MKIDFQIHEWSKYCGRFTDIVALKTSAVAGEEKEAGGKTP